MKGLISAEEVRAKAKELELEGLITAEQARAIAAEANKVDKEIAGVQTGDKAIIFNEADGGGAKYEAADGTASFVGVNSDTNGGIGAQLYDIDVASNKGAKLDVTKNGIFYTKGDLSALPAAQRDVSDNEIVVWADIKNLPSGMRFIGYGEEAEGETQEQTIAKIYVAAGYNYPADRKAGDIVLVNDGSATTQYIYANDGWKAIGDADLYATKVELAAEALERAGEDATLQANIDAEAAARAAADTALETNKLNVLPKVDDPEDPGFGWEYHIPYNFEATPDAEKINVTLKTLTLDNKVTKMNFDKTLPAATTTTAGLMTAADKDKLDGLIPMTEAEINAICS